MRRLSLWALVPWTLTVGLVLCFSAPRARAEGNDLTGQRAPEIHVQEGVQGIAAGSTLAAFRGQVVVLKFWFTRCQACRRTLPEFQSLYQRYASRGVKFVAIAYDEAARVMPYLRSSGFTFPVALDPSGVTSTRYGVISYPTTYVIGADGVVKAYEQLSGGLLERELDAAKVLGRQVPARRPFATFPRPSVDSAAPPPNRDVPPAADKAPLALAARPVASPVSQTPASISPEVVSAAPAAVSAAPAALPATPDASPAALVAAPAAPVAAPASHDAAPGAVPASAVPEAGQVSGSASAAALASLPAEPAVPAHPLQVSLPPVTGPVSTADPVSPEGTPSTTPQLASSAGSMPSDSPPDAQAAVVQARAEEERAFGLPPPKERVASGSVAPSQPTSGDQPPALSALAIPPARTLTSGDSPVIEVPLRETPVAAPTVAQPLSPFSGAGAAIDAGDYPAVMRMLEAYSAGRLDASAWQPDDLAEAHRLEGLVREQYRERDASIRGRWDRGDTASALSAARALEADYRDTSLGRSATTLVVWFESHRPATTASR